MAEKKMTPASKGNSKKPRDTNGKSITAEGAKNGKEDIVNGVKRTSY